MFDDEVWKRSIKDLFRPMVAFHLPELHDRIDWNRGHEFLEQELARIMTPETKVLTPIIGPIVMITAVTERL